MDVKARRAGSPPPTYGKVKKQYGKSGRRGPGGKSKGGGRKKA